MILLQFQDERLEALKRRNIQEQQNVKTIRAEYSNTVEFETFFYQTVTSKNLRTMAMEYNRATKQLKVQVIKTELERQSMGIANYAMSTSAYADFCERVLKIEKDRKFNASSSLVFDGVPTRIFAIVSPYKDDPLVVISTSKKPPEAIPGLTQQDEAKLAQVIKGNFLIAGKSGAGKTYLTNYLLSKFCPQNERIGIIQEFNEIYPPNDFSDTSCTPPRVPGQMWNDLEFLTEQSNLMRYDRIFVGEIKSSEAWPFVVNLASGTKGGATIHGTCCQGALQRLRTLCMLAKPNLGEAMVTSFIKDAVDYVVYVQRGKVGEIMKVNTANNGKFQLEPMELGKDDFSHKR